MSRSRGRRGFLSGLVAGAIGLLFAFVPARAYAQASSAVTKAAVAKERGATVEVEEITVVAQKREENIQEVPISITAVTAERLEQHRVTDLISLSELTPNVRINAQAHGEVSANITIRGAGQPSGAVSVQPAAGLYVDGFYIAKVAGSNLDLQDLERAEVLRGPQGTLYGRNTIAGALNMITHKPSEQRAITLQTEAGNYETYKGRVTFNLPLLGTNGLWQSDALGTLSLRQNLMYKSHAGYTRDESPTNVRADGPRELDDLQRYQSMTQVRWRPSKPFTLDYLFEYHNARGSFPLPQLTTLVPGPASTPGSPFNLTPYLQPSRAEALGTTLVCPSPDPNSCRPFLSKTDNRLHILTAAYDLGEVGPLGRLTLKSIAGYRSFYDYFDAPSPAVPLHVVNIEYFQGAKHWSEELQAVGTAPHLNYVVGAYYYGETGSQYTGQNFLNGSVVYLPKFSNRTDSLAPYGQATWTPPILGDRLSLTAGIRWTYEHSRARGSSRCIQVLQNVGGHVVNVCNLHLAPNLDDWQNVASANFADAKGISPNVSASYQWTEDLMTYFRVARGFKSGGINIQTTDPRGMTPFKSENLLQYEAGFKSQLFDRRLQVNAAGYYSDYTDLQESVPLITAGGGIVTTTANVDSAEVWGSEVEVRAVPLRGLEVNATYGLTLASFKKWMELGKNVADQRRFPFQPDHSATLGLGYTAPPTASGTFSANVYILWTDRIFFTPNSTTPAAWRIRSPSYYLVNGQVRFVQIPLTKGSLDLAAFGRNLFNRSYRTYGMDYSAFGFGTNNFGPPRTFGLQLTYNFAEG